MMPSSPPRHLQPFILATYDTANPKRETWTLDRRYSAWSLWVVSDGRPRWRPNGSGRGHILEPGVALLHWGASAGTYTVPAGCRVRAVLFDVHERQRGRHQRYGWEPLEHSPNQPDPATFFGSNPEACLDQALSHSAARLLDRISVRWWRSQNDEHVCNLRLAGWLADLADYCHDGASDPVARAEAWARRAVHSGATVAGMAHVAGMAVATFSLHFAATRGESPGVFLRDLRLSHAADLLTGTDPIGKIASLSGYRNSASFARAFAARYGTSPSGYRRSLQHSD